MKQLKNVWMLPLLIAAVFLGCPTPNDDYTVQKVAVELTAGTGVDVNADDTSASVTFAGANGLALAPADFTVTAGAVISNVSVNGGTATVTVGFAANSDTSIEKTYTVGIAPESTVIKGSATVTITQGYAGDTRRILQAGAAVTAAAGDTSTAVTFTGAAGLTIVGGDDNLEPADFTTSAGATVGAVSVTDDTATVTVSFAANTDTMVKTYAIGIAPNSTLIKGSGTVTVTQAAREVLNAYYVSFSTGNDENAGTEAAPWKTIARVNRQTFQAGDAILFKSGDTWTWDENTMTGKDFLAPQGSGTDGNPITISSYGAGDKPKLEGRGLVDNIIRLDNQQHWEISRLEISNMVEGWTNPMTQNNDQGTLIHEKDLRGIYITGDNGQVLNGFNMHDLYIHDITGQLYWIGGGAFIDNPQPVSSFPGMKNQTGWDASKRTGAIFAETFKGDGINPTTFNNITVENNVLERNSFSGFSVKQHHGGSGGVKWAFPGANEYPYNDSNFKPHTNITVRGNYIDQTGWYHGDGIYLTSVRNALVEKNVVKNPGVCGIELYYCDSITVQYNEVYGSTSKGGGDTNGIDPDVRTSNIIIQYNYVHDCGDGFLICGGQYNTVIIRYNVLYNNTRNWIRDVVNNGIIQVYNNILYNTKAQEETPGTMRFTGWRSANTNNERWEFKNNVFYNAHAGTTGTSFMTGNNSVYANNLYYGVTPPGTPSADSSPVAVTVDALFNGAVNFATGTSAAAVPNNFDFLKPAAGSPLINQGTAYTPEPTRIDAVPNGKDYAGAALSGKDDIGLFAADFKGLAGIVTDQIGGKVQGATVNVGQELSATTNTDGKFAFSSVPSGSYTVQVIKDQFAGSETPFEVNADAVSWLPLSVGEFTGGNVQKTVTGTVTSSGTALAGVTITIRKGTAEAGAGTTGADGRYSIANVTPDSGYTITASKDGYQTQSVSLILSLTSDPDPQNFDILPLVADPAASPASGSRLFKGDTITLSATTAGAAIYYTLNGSTPSDADAEGASILYTGPIQLSSFPITVKAAAFKTGYANSGVMTANYAEAHPVNITYTGLSANGVTLNWAALDGATGYEVSVYSADGEVATASPSGASAAISGAFTAGKNYYAKVRAKKNALVSGWGIARFKLGSSQAAWSENFETASTTDDLPWTLTSSGGNVAQTIADFYSGNKSGRYYFQGTGARHTRLGFSTPVT
ncbi:MAG: carboxypeptidase regulatory-like domain-containing protein, partial [Treponema sp.]|nr:carboxypeptidase regulatory-like domain-containing protein [Treponema sp.]